MTRPFVAAHVWLAVGLTLLVGEWGDAGSYNLFGYGQIDPRLYAAAALTAFGAAGFCTRRWLRSHGAPGAGPAPAGFFALRQAWLIAALVLLLGGQRSGGSAYDLFGYGRVEPPVYWGALITALAAGGFCLLRWGRARAAGGGSPAGRDLARVGMSWLAALAACAVWRIGTDRNPFHFPPVSLIGKSRDPPRFPDDLPVVGGSVLLFVAVQLALVRAAFGRPAPRKGAAGLTDGMRAGVLIVVVAAVGLLVVIANASLQEVEDARFLPWLVALLAVGLLGALVLLIAVLTARLAPAPVGGRATDATPTLLRLLGGLGIAGAGGVILVPILATVDSRQTPTLMGVGLAAVAALVAAVAFARPRPPADGPRCPTCGEPIAPEAPAGLCPRCLLKGGMPAGPGSAPALAFVESFAAPPVEDVRRLFPHLEVERLIGQGGMEAVYLARQPALGRPVALKLIRRRTNDPTFAERFAREARAMARLSHPNVVAVHESGEAGGLPYLLMEYVSGPTLRDVMRTRALTPAAALAVVRQVCDALEFAHCQGVVHRDIKPENILLSGVGDQESGVSEDRALTPDSCPLTPGLTAKITDFGLAKVIDPNGVSLTGTLQAMGTPHYMAPEQWERPAAVDHRADIFALGVVLYELLTGELPLGRFDPPSRKIEVDIRVDEVVLRALEKEPGRRYQHAREVGTDLDNIRAGSGPEAPA